MSRDAGQSIQECLSLEDGLDLFTGLRCAHDPEVHIEARNSSHDKRPSSQNVGPAVDPCRGNELPLLQLSWICVDVQCQMERIYRSRVVLRRYQEDLRSEVLVVLYHSSVEQWRKGTTYGARC